MLLYQLMLQCHSLTDRDIRVRVRVHTVYTYCLLTARRHLFLCFCVFVLFYFIFYIFCFLWLADIELTDNTAAEFRSARTLVPPNHQESTGSHGCLKTLICLQLIKQLFISYHHIGLLALGRPPGTFYNYLFRTPQPSRL